MLLDPRSKGTNCKGDQILSCVNVDLVRSNRFISFTFNVPSFAFELGKKILDYRSIHNSRNGISNFGNFFDVSKF